MGVVEFCKRRLRVLQILFVWLFLVFGFFGGVGCFGLPGLFRGLTKVYALDDNISVTLEAVLSLALSDTTVNIPVTPSDTGTFSSSSFTATVSSNNSTGYKLLLTDYDTDTNLVHAVTSTATIPTLSSNTTKTSFPSNQWGLSLDDTNYLPTPASNGTAITVKEATTPVSNQASTVYAGAKVTNTTMSGAYTDVVTISLIANPTPTSFNQAYALAGMTKSQAVDNHYYYTMQDMNKSICDLTANEQQTTLVDIRDNKTYTIFKSKAPDSKCWMNQNLDLDLSSSITLTNQNTDLNSVNSWKPDRSTLTSDNFNSTNWKDDFNTPYSYNPGNIYYYTSGDTSDDTQYTSLDACKVDHTETECKHYHAGNYYNFSAAVASNDTSASTTQYTVMPNSICPRSWRLPQGPLNASDYSDFNDLLATYGIINSGASGDNVYLPDGFNNLRVNPLFSVRSGYVSNGNHLTLGFSGNYWTSSIVHAERSYIMLYKPTFINPQFLGGRNGGFSIRCLADNRYEYSLNYHPNSTNVSNLPSRQTARSTDSTYTFTINSVAPVKTDYNFLGYATSPNGDVAYQPGDTISILNSAPTITLYAKWAEGVTFSQAYSQAEKTTINVGGIDYYKMQDMNNNICHAVGVGQETTLVDTRDNNTYTVFKANDRKCWMNQNLDFNLSSGVTLYDTNTDLNSVTSWTPGRGTIATNNLSTYADSDSTPYSYDPGDVYWYTSGTNADDTKYSSFSACTGAGHTESECKHYHAGNYYNFSAAVANNNTAGYSTDYTQMPNSICPKGWKLPQGPINSSIYSEFDGLLAAYGIKEAGASNSYLTDGFNRMRVAPLFFVRPGNAATGALHNLGKAGFYWSTTVNSAEKAYIVEFHSGSGSIRTQRDNRRFYGFQVRCVAR